MRRLAPAAFHDLYELLADGLNSFAYSMLRDANAAEDAVQQAFLELVQAALRRRRRRVATSPSAKARQRRLESKRRRSRLKERRRRPTADDG